MMKVATSLPSSLYRILRVELVSNWEKIMMKVATFLPSSHYRILRVTNLCQTERRSWWKWQHLYLLRSTEHCVSNLCQTNWEKIMMTVATSLPCVSKCQTERWCRFRGEMSACQRKFSSVASNLLLIMCWSMKKFISLTFINGSSKKLNFLQLSSRGIIITMKQ